MRRFSGRSFARICVIGPCACGMLYAQQALDWATVRSRFRANNPSLQAGQLNIEESRANEITSGLRPNPELSFVADQFRIFNPNPLQPFQNTQITPVVSELIERRNKRQLRVESSKALTSVAQSDQDDLERNLIFNLRDAFIKALQAKALLALAQDNLTYYDKVIATNRERLNAGDISRADFARVELQRVQFESDLVNARVNLRTSRINLQSFLNDHSPIDSFDITGPFEYQEHALIPEELRQIALATRPDLQSAARSVLRAKADNRLAWANGSWDPTVGVEYQRSGPDNTAGVTLNLPLRFFDQNQGEKQRTSIEITRTERNRQAIELGVIRDVDSAYATLDSVAVLLRPYRDKYLAEASEVRELVSFAYRNGAASLLDFLDAQKSYRDTLLNYLNLVGSYLSSANQLNLAVGREVIP